MVGTLDPRESACSCAEMEIIEEHDQIRLIVLFAYEEVNSKIN